MSDYLLSCCSSVDLSADRLAERNIRWIPFHFTLNGKDYADDLGQTLSYADFYRSLREGATVSTSQVPVGEYEDYFTRLLSEGKDVLHICFSSGLSGTYRSALLAADTVREKFPGQRLVIVDSLAGSTGYGLLMEELADRRDGGMDILSLAAWTEANKSRLNHWFFSTDLTAYVRGGRLSKTAGWVGGLLEICPLMDMDGEGRLAPRMKIRTKKRVKAVLVDRMEALADNGADYDGRCFLCHSDALEDAEEVADAIRARFPRLKSLEIHEIGTTIGCHSGPGTVAVFFFGEPRTAAGEATRSA